MHKATIIPRTILPQQPATASLPSLDQYPRYKRTRAKRSCDTCRKKKSRCDADKHKPCSNCAQTGGECTFLEQRKKRGQTSSGDVAALQDRLQRMESLLHELAHKSPASNAGRDFDTSEKLSTSPGPGMGEHVVEGLSTLSLPPSPASLSSHTQKNRLDSATLSSSSDNGSPSDNHVRGSIYDDNDAESSASDSDSATNLYTKLDSMTIKDYESTRYMGSSAGLNFLGQGVFTRAQGPILFLGKDRRIIQRLNDEEDLVILNYRVNDEPTDRAFDAWPPKELMDRLIDLYFQKVHPIMPVIHKQQFLRQYNSRQPSPTPPLLLNSVFAIASRFIVDVPAATLIIDESNSKEEKKLAACELGRFFFERAEQMLETEGRKSRLSTVQSLLLLSMYFDISGEEEDSRHWFTAGKAIRMAQDLGLHRSASKWHIPSSEAELRRRIWFGCYLIDRWTAAEMGRPMTILDYDYDTELPSAYEIQDGSLTADDVPSSSQTSFGEPIYMAFIQLIKLSEILGQVLQGLYSPRARATGLGLTDADSLVNILDRSLTNWKLALPKELRYQPGKSKEQSNLPGTAMLMLCYYTVLMLLHRPFISIDKRNQQLDFQSLSICTNAANNIIAISEEMDVHDFLSFSWTISIYTIFQSSIIHLHNASNENAHISNMAKSNLRRCIEILRVRSFVAAQKAAEILIVLINIHLAPDKISEAKKGSKEVKCASVLKHIIVNVKEDKNSPAKIEAVKDESPVTGSYLVASADSSGVDFEITVDSLSNLHNSNPKPPVQDPVFNTIQHLNEGTWEAANSVGDTQFSARPDVHLASLSPNVPSRQDSPQSSTMQQSFDNDFLVYASSGSLSPVFTFDSAQLQQQQQGNNGEVANIGLALRMDLPNPLWGIPTSINWNEWDDYITSMSH